jgi:hypothetical protein
MMSHRRAARVVPCSSRPGLPGLRAVRRAGTHGLTAAHRARRAWVPTLLHGNGDIAATKFGGMPFMPAGLHWPRCQTAGDPMIFLCQIAASSPGSPFAHIIEPGTMLQFFADADGNSLHSAPGSVLGRLITAPEQDPASSLSATNSSCPPPGVELLEPTASACDGRSYYRAPVGGLTPCGYCAAVTQWTEIEDYPGPEEPAFPSSTAEQYSGGEDAYIDKYCPATGIKVGGWAYWVRCCHCCISAVISVVAESQRILQLLSQAVFVFGPPPGADSGSSGATLPHM